MVCPGEEPLLRNHFKFRKAAIFLECSNHNTGFRANVRCNTKEQEKSESQLNCILS